MKIIVTVGLFFTAALAYGQDVEELKRRILALEHSQDQVQLNLRKHQKQHSLGTAILISGAATTLLAGILYDHGLRNGNVDMDTGRRAVPSPAFLVLGGALMTAGTIIQIDSHKWIGRAGRKRRE